MVGASSGIGKATAQAFARVGAQVIAAVRNPSQCADLRDSAAGSSGSLELIRLDLTQPTTFAAAVGALETATQPVVVITAGLLRAGALEDLSELELRQVIETNLTGPLALIRSVLPILRRQGGTIIVTSSLSGLAGLPGDVAYAASKWGIEGALEALRHEVDRFGVRVALVEFGLVNTALFDHDMAAPIPLNSPYRPLTQWQRDSLRARLGEGLSPEAVADAIVAIADQDDGRLRHPVGALAERVIGSLLAQDDLTRDQYLRAVSGTDWWSHGTHAPD